MKQAYCVCGSALHQVFRDSEKVEVICANCGSMVIMFLLTKNMNNNKMVIS